jgi:hypothetical protein
MSLDRPERPGEETTPTYKAFDTYQDLLAYASVLWCSNQASRCMPAAYCHS